MADLKHSIKFTPVGPTDWSGSESGVYNKTLTLPTSDTYVDRNIEIVVDIPAATGSVEMAAGEGSVTGSNCTLSSTDTSGIAVTGKGSASAIAKITGAGYTPSNDNFATGETVSSSEVTQYLTGITLNKGKKIDITNDINDTVTLEYSSDTNSINFVFE